MDGVEIVRLCVEAGWPAHGTGVVVRVAPLDKCGRASVKAWSVADQAGVNAASG